MPRTAQGCRAHSRHWRSLAARSIPLLLAGVVAAHAQAGSPAGEWKTNFGRGHNLVGLIYAPTTRRILQPAQAIEQLRPADFVLLGEKHDNPDHHSLQGWVIEALTGAGRRYVVAFEMISRDQAAGLADWRRGEPTDPLSLGPAIGWERTGWPAWSIYAPIASAAMSAGWPLAAADLPAELRRQIGRSGLTAIEPGLAQRLGLNATYDSAQAASLRAEIVASHCGHASEDMVAPMSDVQRVRDAHFAVSMIEGIAEYGVDGAILIAGGGHVRADRGVPWHLARLAPGKTAATLAFVEVDDARTAPEQYRGGSDGAAAPFDLLWFTPRFEDADPCDKFAEQLRRMRERRPRP